MPDARLALEARLVTGPPTIVDLFAGPGGWDYALHEAGRTDVLDGNGFELGDGTERYPTKRAAADAARSMQP